MTDQSKFKQEGYDLMAAAFEVHNEMGGGLLEELYQEGLEIELTMREIPFTRKQELRVFYKQRELKKRYIPDLIVFGGLIVELKSCRELNNDHKAQLLNYMRITHSSVGYLVNFGPISGVEWERFIL